MCINREVKTQENENQRKNESRCRAWSLTITIYFGKHARTMQNVLNWVKAVVSGVVGFISLELGMLAPLLVFLAVSMAFDYLSGVIAAGSRGELNSRLGVFGILKKLGYCIAVGVALITDKLIMTIGSELTQSAMPAISLFGTLTIVWLTLNELLSTLENLGRMGVPLPGFLGKVIKTLKKKVDSKGDNASNEDASNVN